jgi:hypothetical protein
MTASEVTVSIPLYPAVNYAINLDESKFNDKTGALFLAVAEAEVRNREKTRFFKAFILDPLPKDSRQFKNNPLLNPQCVAIDRETNYPYVHSKSISRIIEVYYYTIRKREQGSALVSKYIGKRSQIKDMTRRSDHFTLAQKIVSLSLAIDGDCLIIDLIGYAYKFGAYGFEMNRQESRFWSGIGKKLFEKATSHSNS